MKTRVLAVFAVLATLLAAKARAGVLPNIMIEFDNSGSMNNSVQSLPAYDPTKSYVGGAGIPSYSTGTVYQLNADNSYSIYANNIGGVGSAGAQASLSTYGLWFGVIGPIQLKLFTGNYLNYETCPTGSNPGICTAQIGSFTKISIAKRIVTEITAVLTNAQWGVMDFDPACSPGMSGTCNGVMVSSIPSTPSQIAAKVNAISANTYTPLGPTLTSVGQYYAGTFQGLQSPITNSCQSNSVIIVTDGQFNVPNSNVGDPVSDPAVIATGLHNNQNLVINTIGLNSPSDPLSGTATQDLQNTANNGGGLFFNNNTTTFAPQLEQALFSLPSAITITSPANLSIISQTVPITVTLQKVSCISSVQYYLDNAPLGSPVFSAPFTYNWDTTTVLNGSHTITAVTQDFAGNSSVSQPVIVITVNDQNPPVISNINVSVGYTTATITWTTNKLSDTQVYYGTTTAYGLFSPLDSSKVTSHSVALSGLTPGTQYHSQVRSRDSAGNLATLGDIPFQTLTIIAGGALDHFKVTFRNNGSNQFGPGTKTGSYPYALTVGDCFAATIEGVDTAGLHSNFNGTINLAQYLLGNTGVELGLAPGIAMANAFALGISSMDLDMVNGFTFLGSDSDFSRRLCFYRATRAPGDLKGAGALGDLEVKVIESGNPAISGVSASYVAWHGSAFQIALLGPIETLAPATVSGTSGTLISELQGSPFSVEAHLADRYWNQILNNAGDTIRFSAAVPGYASFNPVQGAASGGVAYSTVTVSTCGAQVQILADDQTQPSLAAGQLSLTVQCSTVPVGLGEGFFQLAIPGLNTATQSFPMTITIKNQNVPVGSGSVRYSVQLIPLVPTDATHFAPAPGALGIPTVQFSIDASTPPGDFTFTIPNQTYPKSGTIWIELLDTGSPASLNGATAMAGPMLVLPGPAAKLTVTSSPGVVPANGQAQLTATLTDALGNGIPNATVDLSVAAGSGHLVVSGVNVGFDAKVQTDANGLAVITFVGGMTSEGNVISAFATQFQNVPKTQVSVLTSLLGDKIVAAYPSPVKITQRPLTIEYQLQQNSDVRLIVSDLFGHEVWRTSFSAGSSGGKAGFNVTQWDGRNGSGVQVAAGAYGLRLEMTANGQTTKATTKFGVWK